MPKTAVSRPSGKGGSRGVSLTRWRVGTGIGWDRPGKASSSAGMRVLCLAKNMVSFRLVLVVQPVQHLGRGSGSPENLRFEKPADQGDHVVGGGVLGVGDGRRGGAVVLQQPGGVA